MKKKLLSKNLVVFLLISSLSLSCNVPNLEKTSTKKTNEVTTIKKQEKIDPNEITVNRLALNNNNTTTKQATSGNPLFKPLITTQKPVNEKKFNLQLLDNIITNVSGNQGASQNSNITVDSAGVPHVVWEEKLFTNAFLDDFYSRFDNTTSSWIPYTNVTNQGVTKVQPKNPSIAITSIGNAFLAFSFAKGIYYMKLDVATNKWSLISKLAISSTTESMVKVITGTTKVHIIWTSGNDIWYSSSSDEGTTWTTPENVSFNPKTNSIKPSIAIDSADNPYVTWEEIEGGNHAIQYTRRFATDWYASQVVSRSTAQGISAYNPAIALDYLDLPSVVWEQDINGRKSIYISKNTNNADPTAWDTSKNISNINSKICKNPKITSDNMGIYHAVWEVFGDGIYYSKVLDIPTNTWSTPEKISQTQSSRIYKNPSMYKDTIGNGVHVTWESNIENSLYSIYHIRKNGIAVPIVNRTVEITTNKGVFQAILYEDKMPITTANFISLINKNFYSGLTYHRYVSGFVIQGGDPTGTGTGGSGTNIPLETNPLTNFDKAGILGMARATDPNSASSQYFVTLAPASSLNNQYAAFGEVTQGMAVVNSLVQGDIMSSIKVLP